MLIDFSSTTQDVINDLVVQNFFEIHQVILSEKSIEYVQAHEIFNQIDYHQITELIITDKVLTEPTYDPPNT